MIIITVMGGILASFLYALTQNNTIDFFKRRSKCDHCQIELNVLDLIPVFGFLKNRGTCRGCHSKISSNYIICELLVMSLFLVPVFLPIAYDDLVLYYLFVAIFIPLAIYDFETMLIPLHMVLILLLAGLFLSRFENVEIVADTVTILILHILYMLFKDKIGYGDIQLFSVLSLLTPLDFFIFTFLFTYIVGGLTVIVLDFFTTQRITKVPLVPFIASSLIMTFYLYIDFNDIYFGGF